MQHLLRVLSSALLWRLACSTTELSNTAQVARSYQNSSETAGLPMLQLMSLSLDNWGSVHHLESAPVVESLQPRRHLRQKLSHPAQVKASKPPVLSLLSVSLDTWGSKASNCTTPELLDMIVNKGADHVTNPLAQVLASETNLFDPRSSQAHSMSLFLEPGQKGAQVRNVGILVFILLLFGFTLVYLCWDGGSSDHDDPPPFSEEAEQDFATVEFTDGSWAQVYREARGEQKEALELLFRCNIISTDEFAFSSVSQDHIHECMWIATHMLRQKPLEEWVALWQQAQQTFEDSVTACFEARGGAPSNSYSSFTSPGNLHMQPPRAVANLSLGAVPLSGYGNRSGSPGSPGSEDDDDDPYTTRSHYSPESLQDNVSHGPVHAMHMPDSQASVIPGSDASRWSIESELDRGLAAHSPK